MIKVTLSGQRSLKKASMAAGFDVSNLVADSRLSFLPVAFSRGWLLKVDVVGTIIKSERAIGSEAGADNPLEAKAHCHLCSNIRRRCYSLTGPRCCWPLVRICLALKRCPGH